MDTSQTERLRSYAWSYFEYHAEQRMRTFHFYLIIIAALMAGFTSAAPRVPRELFPWLSIIGFLMAIFSLAFALIDQRNAGLVRNGEVALKALDSREGLPDQEDGSPNVLCLFHRDDFVCQARPKYPDPDSHISYSSVLQVLFWLIGILGIVGAVICLVHGPGNGPNGGHGSGVVV